MPGKCQCRPVFVREFGRTRIILLLLSSLARDVAPDREQVVGHVGDGAGALDVHLAGGHVLIHLAAVGHQNHVTVVGVLEIAQFVDEVFLAGGILLRESALGEVVDNEQVDAIPPAGVGENLQQTVSLRRSREVEDPQLVVEPLEHMLNFSTLGRLLQMTWRTRRAKQLTRLQLQRSDAGSDALGHCADGDMPSHLGFAVVVDAVDDREFRFTKLEVTVQARPRTDKHALVATLECVDGVLQKLRRRAKFIGIK